MYHLGAWERLVLAPVTSNRPDPAIQENLPVTTLSLPSCWNTPFSPPLPQKMWLPPTPNSQCCGHTNTLAASLPFGELQQPFKGRKAFEMPCSDMLKTTMKSPPTTAHSRASTCVQLILLSDIHSRQGVLGLQFV